MKAVKKAVLYAEKRVNSEMRFYVRKYFRLKKGEYILVKLPKKDTAIIACPRCGTPRPLSSHTVTMIKGIITVDPSINNNNGGCCDYHGWLRNGIFTDV